MLSRTKGLALNVHRICLEPCGWNLHRTASSLTPRLQRQSLSSSAFAMSLIRHPPDGRTAPPFQPHEPRGSCEHFHTSSICFASPPDDVAASQALSDPSRPDLFYHLVGPPSPLSSSRPVFAVSFLSAPPTTPESSTILGWLPATTDAHAQQHVGLSDFKENPRFRDFLHRVVLAGLREGVDDIQINAAVQLQQGWMHIHDNRNVPALGRIGDPDDIIASVLVQDGKILVDTYQPMPSYRFCTSDGLTQLTDGLARKLLLSLQEQADADAKEEHASS